MDGVSTVALWTLECLAPRPSDIAAWRGVVSPDELRRSERFVRHSDRTTYLAAHALLRVVLEAVGGRPASNWTFCSDGIHRPHLSEQNPTNLEFSLAHTHGMAACIVAAGHPVGVDVEPLNRRPLKRDVLATILSPDELAFVVNAPEGSGHERFLELWTLREAYVKATGQGLQFPNETFSFALNPPRLVQPVEGPSRWHFGTSRLEGHILSWAIELGQARDVGIQRRHLNSGALI